MVNVDGNNNSDTTVIGAGGSTVTVSLATTAVTVTEGGKALFPVVLSGKVAGELTVGYTITAPATDGATDVTDYPDYSTATPRQVVFEEGETRATIEVNTTPDSRAENTETFTLRLTLSGQADGVSPGTTEATGTIRDDDRLSVTVEGPGKVAEDGAGTYHFRLTGGTTGSADVTVAYTATGTADGTRTIRANEGVSADALSVSASGMTGSLTVEVTRVTTAAGTVSSGVGQKKVTEILPARTAIVSVGDVAEAPEGNDASFPVTVSGVAAGDVTVEYRVNSGTASTADFETPNPRRVVLTTNSGSIPVPVVDDDVVEGAETFSVTLTGASDDNGGVQLGTTTGTATIPADEPLMARVESQDMTVLEGESATFVVDLGGTSSASVEIDYTVVGATVSDRANVEADEDDFTPEKGKLTIPAGRSTGTIQIEAVDDDILEPNEGLQVMLSGAAPANVVNVDDEPAQTVIGASDSPARVSVADVTVDEGETAMIEVKLSKEVSSQVSVPFGLNPLPDDTDYFAPNPVSPLVFMPGDTAKTIEIETKPDTLAEDEETFTVTLNPPSPVVIGVSLGRNVATVTITDDALRATIEGPASVNEGDDAVYTVTVTGGTFGTGEDDQVTVTWSTEGGSATSADFSPTGGTLVLSAEDPSAMFTIQTEDDDIPELGEIIEVSLTAQSVVDGEPEPVRTGAPARTMIVDDDGAVEVSIMADQTVVAEGQQATFTVELDGCGGVRANAPVRDRRRGRYGHGGHGLYGRWRRRDGGDCRRCDVHDHFGSHGA